MLETLTTRCQVCEENKIVDNFFPYRRCVCKDCVRAKDRKRDKKRRECAEYREKHAIFYRNWYAENGRSRNPNYTNVSLIWNRNNTEKVQAVALVTKAIKKGRMERALVCLLCGRATRTQGHHEDYNKPYDVKWLCASCHKKTHLISAKA